MISQLTVQGVYAENCYFYIDDTSRAGFLIDPGAQPGLILDTIRSNGWDIEKILLTHGHFDHIGAAAQLHYRLGAPIYIYPSDAPYLTDTYLNLSARSGNPVTVSHYEELYDGETVRLKANSAFNLKVIHTPGHTPGSVTFYSRDAGAAFVGDLLYDHGPGLTQFPGGNSRQLESSIVNKIFTLPDDTVLLSGHSSPVIVGEEKRLLLR